MNILKKLSNHSQKKCRIRNNFNINARRMHTTFLFFVVINWKSAHIFCWTWCMFRQCYRHFLLYVEELLNMFACSESILIEYGKICHFENCLKLDFFLVRKTENFRRILFELPKYTLNFQIIPNARAKSFDEIIEKVILILAQYANVRSSISAAQIRATDSMGVSKCFWPL